MTSIIIVDDQSSIREFLKINLSTEVDIQVVATADNGRSAIAQVAEHQPDMVLMDIEMPGGMDGIEATATIVERFPQIKVLLFTSQDNKQQLNRALKVGARGYVLKNTSIKDISNIIRLTAKGFFQIGPILGNWHDSQLSDRHSLVTKLQPEYISSQTTNIFGQNPEYSYANGRSTIQSSPMNQTISDLTPDIFQLQETIRSQRDTISDLTNKYSQVQQEIQAKLQSQQRRNYHGYGRLAGYNSRSKSRFLSLGKQNFLFIVSFLLGVVTVGILFFLVMMLG